MESLQVPGCAAEKTSPFSRPFRVENHCKNKSLVETTVFDLSWPHLVTTTFRVIEFRRRNGNGIHLHSWLSRSNEMDRYIFCLCSASKHE